MPALGASVTPSPGETMSPVSVSTVAGLVLQARDAGGDALASLLSWVHAVSLRYARARLGRFGVEDAAHDVAQEVCMAVHVALPGYTDRGLPFEAFVYSIAARKVADVQRRAYRAPKLIESPPERQSAEAGPEERAVRSDDAARAWSAIRQLSDAHREVLVLRVALGWSTEETAAAMGMTAGTVRVTQHRALAKVRALLAAGVET